MELQVMVIALLIPTGSAAAYGFVCSTANECPNENHQCVKVHPSCSVRVCLCKEGYISMAGGPCLPEVNVGENCTASSNCKPKYVSSCSESTNTCQCDYGLEEKNGQCLAGNKLLSENCIDDGDCKGFSGHPHAVRCINGKCACYAYLAEDKVQNRCHLVEHGGSCIDSECMILHKCSLGSNGYTCQCNEGYSPVQISVRFSKDIQPYEDKFIHVVCIRETANLDVGVGEECEVPGLVPELMKVCKTGLLCEYCSHTGPHVCVASAALEKPIMLMVVVLFLVTLV